MYEHVRWSLPGRHNRTVLNVAPHYDLCIGFVNPVRRAQVATTAACTKGRRPCVKGVQRSCLQHHSDQPTHIESITSHIPFFRIESATGPTEGH